MNFNLEISDPSSLIVVCDPDCEDALSVLSPASYASTQRQQPPGAVCVRLSRGPDGRLLLRLLGSTCGSPPPAQPPVPVIEINNGVCQLEAEEEAPVEATIAEPLAAAAEAIEKDSDNEEEEEELAVENKRSSYASSTDSPPVASVYANALEEFAATEQNYVRRLGLVYDAYYPGLVAAVQARQLGCCSVEDLKGVFGHFQGMRLLHEQLLADVGQAGMLGRLMAQYAYQLKSYSTYYSMFPHITATVRGWMTDEAFRQAFVQLRAEHAELGESQLDLLALLLEPVQRPMRYPLLLERYLSEVGSDDPEWQSASRAVQTVQVVLKELEKSLRDFSAFQERLQLLRSIAFPAGLAAHWEEFAHSCLRHGPARQDEKQRYLLLSKATLLICSTSRFRQDAWNAKRAVAVPGDLRVLGCEGSLLRMDTAKDPHLHLQFGNPPAAGTDASAADAVGAALASGVRECRDWAMELRRLGVPFIDSPAQDDERLMPWERTAGRTGRPVMTPLDKAPRCQACGSVYRRGLQRRRLSCRICGGAFCSDCADYQATTSWAGDRPLRCCLFCRVAAGASPAELASSRHRELLDRFRAVRALDADPETLAGPLTAWLSGRWAPLWCRVDRDGRGLSLYRARRDFLPVLTIERPRLQQRGALAADATDQVGGAAAAAAAELVVHDHERRLACRLRRCDDRQKDSGSTADESGSLIDSLAARLSRCVSVAADCTDQGDPTTEVGDLEMAPELD